jgi:hypothetical protein
MVCQYSKRRPVPSEKHETTSEAEVVERRGGDTAGVAVAAVVMGGYCPLPESLTASLVRLTPQEG